MSPPPYTLSEGEMTPKSADEHTSLAVIENEIRHIRESLQRIETANAANVTVQAWQQRNEYVDHHFIEHATDIKNVEAGYKAEIARLWAEIKSKKISWTSLGALIAAIVAIFLQFEQLIGKGS